MRASVRLRTTPFAFRRPRTQLADVTGLTGVHVNRVLQRLRQDELLSFTQQRVTILDRAALFGAAGFDREYLQLDSSPARLAA